MDGAHGLGLGKLQIQQEEHIRRSRLHEPGSDEALELDTEVAFSSCEAEVYAMNKGAAEATGVTSLPEDMVISIGIVLRTVGKMRHISTQKLWMQSASPNHDTEVRKIDGEDNIADTLTKNVKAAVLEEHVAAMRFSMEETMQKREASVQSTVTESAVRQMQQRPKRARERRRGTR